MYHVVICDDEKEILNDIYKKVRACFDENNMSAKYTCIDDARELMECIRRERIDILFLDIDMPYYSGMDIAGYVNEQEWKTILIFVTSHDALVYQTFAYRPFGFIRKTHMDEELDELAKRVHKELLENQQELVIQKGQELSRILLNDIVYIEAEGNYLVLQLRNDKLRIRETMTNIENKLYGKGFIRCHKGYLVNAGYIEKVKSTEIQLKLGNESMALPIGRSYEKDVRKRILEILRLESE
ncbi:MAG: LytTR family DNA-binding domain-containing protein [Lachnospiraceae bacterium]|nr:LytTR family DNA-binding domain-containing protein [Lachnospiraceae bacterium]